VSPGSTRFKMRRLLLASDDAISILLKPACSEPSDANSLSGKPSHRSPYNSWRSLEAVFSRSRIQNLAARFEEVMGAGDGLRGIGRVVQCLAENHQVHAFRIDGGFSRSPRRKSRFFKLFFFALAAPKATIFSELSTAMTLLHRRASNSLNKPSPDPRSATTRGGKMRSSRWPKACHERPGP